MAEHSERRHHRGTAVLTRARIVGVLAGALRWIGTIVAVVLVAHVVLTVGGANPENGITQFVAGWADPLALGFRDLFMPEDAKARVLVNYGIAALFWLIVTSIVVKIVRRLG
ncbi:hypothetical protein [Crossiella sp. NPDC003009]